MGGEEEWNPCPRFLTARVRPTLQNGRRDDWTNGAQCATDPCGKGTDSSHLPMPGRRWFPGKYSWLAEGLSYRFR